MKALRGLLALLFSAVPGAAQAQGELITGVVDPQGAAGVQNGPNAEWTLVFAFDSWRGADGGVHTTRLSIRAAWPYDKMSAAMDRINASRTISARVRFTAEDAAELLELVDARLPAGDPLSMRAAELARPVTREDTRFGTLTLNRGLSIWEGKAAWAGDTIDFDLRADDEDELRAALAVAAALWDDQAGWSERIHAYAVEQLLETRNEGWLDEGEAPLTAAQFRARMRLERISVEPDGSFTFWHNDGALFAGHTIQIIGNLRDGPTDADIPG